MKHAKVAAWVKQYEGRGVDPRYAGYFELFNEQKFYEAHDVLEDLWLADRKGPDGNYYKGLIQLAGAFVHLQKGRLRPSAALFNLAYSNLAAYPKSHHQINLCEVLNVISTWQKKLDSGGYQVNPIHSEAPPQLRPLFNS